MSTALFVVDTNLLAAGLIISKPGSPTAKILDAMLDGSLLYLLSPDLLNEYELVLQRPGLLRPHGLTVSEIEQLLTEITASAIWREPRPDSLHLSPDPGDAHDALKG